MHDTKLEEIEHHLLDAGFEQNQSHKAVFDKDGVQVSTKKENHCRQVLNEMDDIDE